MNEEKIKLKKAIETDLTDVLNSYVEGTSFEEEDILEVIKEVSKEMKY